MSKGWLRGGSWPSDLGVEAGDSQNQLGLPLTERNMFAGSHLDEGYTETKSKQLRTWELGSVGRSLRLSLTLNLDRHITKELYYENW